LDSLIFAEDVQIDDLSDSMAVLELYGPSVSLGSEAEAALPAPEAPSDLPFQCVFDGSLGLNAVVAYAATDLASQMAQHLALGAVEVGLDTLDIIRVEAGVPRFGVDMTDETIPLEAGIEDRAISFT